MKLTSRLILSTSPPTQTGGKPPGLQALRCRKRLPCQRIRYWPVVKELDAETGLYYYGARYLDPKTSRWLSGDPAMGEYIPSAPVNEEARKRNGNLPGMGGVFNHVNLHVYHYAGNNPVKYEDPDGRDVNDSIVNPDPLAQLIIFKNLLEKAWGKIMNERFVNEGMKMLGANNYVWGGKNPEADGGTDCSGTVSWAAEQVAGQSLRVRNANEQASDPSFSLPGDNSRGTLNFYDWNGDGVFDHVTINLGDGTEINPFGNRSNTIDNPAPIIITPIPQRKENEIRANRILNWRHLTQ